MFSSCSVVFPKKVITPGSAAEDVGNSEKCWDYNAATHHWPASTRTFIRVQSILQLLLSTKPLGNKYKSHSSASSTANITGTKCGDVPSIWKFPSLKWSAQKMAGETGSCESWLHQLWGFQESLLKCGTGKIAFWVLNPCTVLWKFTEIV